MSRRRRNFFITICVLTVAAMFVLDHHFTGQSLVIAPPAYLQSLEDKQKYHCNQFSVIKVVDGDTIDIDIPDGNYPHTRIRLWGVDTPETKNPRTGVMFFGKEAAEFTASIAGGKKVTIYLDIGNHQTRGKYGRLLAYVQLPDGTFLNERLLTDGYAYADVRFRHSLYNKYKQLEAVARNEGNGLWAEVQFEQMPKWLQRERPELAERR